MRPFYSSNILNQELLNETYTFQFDAELSYIRAEAGSVGASGEEIQTRADNVLG
jgi:hypothetical protein